MPKTNDAALAAFISAKIEIDAMLESLVALSGGTDCACGQGSLLGPMMTTQNDL